MATEPKSRRRRRKKILMKNDGSLFDASERRRITQAELRDYVRDGGLFEARRHETGADCTYEVLQSVVGAGFLQNLVPGVGGGGLGTLSGLGRLSELASGGRGLADLARLLGNDGGERGWEDWEEPSRRQTRRSEDRPWEKADWADPPRPAPRHDDPDWATDADFE